MDDAPNPIAAAQITAAMNAFMVLPLEGHAFCSVKLAGSDASEVSLCSRPRCVAWQSRDAYGPYVLVIEGANENREMR